MSKGWAIGLALIIGGCANQETTATAAGSYNQCAASVMQGAAYQTVMGKIPMPGSRAIVSMEIRANDQRPTEVEAAALVQLNRELAPCRDGVVSSIADPVEASIVAHAIAARQNAYAQLVRGESTWGEYAQASERIGLGAETELARVRSAAAAQQSANAALVLSRGPIFQTPQFQRPTTTNCWYTGSLLNCSTF